MEEFDLVKSFYYDETSPSCLRWKEDRYSGKSLKKLEIIAHSCAGTINNQGYWTVKVGKRKTRAVHRIILTILGDMGITSLVKVDHINGVKTDNIRTNLRVVDHTTNCRNSCRASNNTSGITGVGWASNNGGNHYVRAMWLDLFGVQEVKFFSVTKLGLLPAFRDAVEYRKRMIDELNQQGAGYTNRHGH